MWLVWAVLAALPSQTASSQPASAPTATINLKIRAVYGHNKSTSLDPKINDLFGLLKNLSFTGYDLKEESAMKLAVDGEGAKQNLPAGRHLMVTAKGYKQKKNRGEVRIELEIPELKFKTKASVMAGATLVIGGPKFEDGVLFFALTATSIEGASSYPQGYGAASAPVVAKP